MLVLSLVAFLLILAPSIEWIDRRWREKKLNEIKEVASSIAQIVQNELEHEKYDLRNEIAVPAISLDALPETADVAAKSTTPDKTRT